MPPLESTAVVLLLWTIIGYVLGSIPFGMVLARVMGLGNLREIGSGNIGATNVLRTGNKLAAALTLILDAGKGALAVLLARAFAGEDAVHLAGLAALLGHCYPVWLRFQGGKGVATFLGVVLALSWPVGIAACLTWLATAAVTRISSLSALVAVVASPFFMLIFKRAEAVALVIALTAIILWRHRGNIARLVAGSEPKIGRR